MFMNPFEQTKELYNQGLNIEELRQQLVELGYEGETLEEHLRFVKKLKTQKQVKFGFNLILVGPLLCVSSCIATFFHSYSASYMSFSLYGMTFIGASLVVVGLGYVFGF